MLSDPLSVTYNGNVKSLARATGTFPGAIKQLGASFYNTADREFEMSIRQLEIAGKRMRRAEILLSRRTPDSDSDPYNGGVDYPPNRFGFVYEVNNLNYATTVDIPLLRSAVSALVDSAFEVKLTGGQV